MRSCILVNSKSGGWQRQRALLQPLIAKSNARLVTWPDQGAMKQEMENLLLGGMQRVVLVGGDGTISRFVNEAYPLLDQIELALIPAGTGNDLARSIGLHGRPIEEIFQTALTAAATPIDLIRVTNGKTCYAANAVTGAFGGIVGSDISADDKRKWGSIAYWLNALSHLGALEEFEVHIECDSDTISLSTYGITVANGRFVGGGFPAAPTAVVNDGLLDLTAVPVLSPLELLAGGVDFSLGRHNETERVRTCRAAHIRIHSDPMMPYSLDGEPTRGIDATFEAVPNAIRMVCGNDAPAVVH